jgi:hypothetical protein
MGEYYFGDKVADAVDVVQVVEHVEHEHNVETLDHVHNHLLRVLFQVHALVLFIFKKKIIYFFFIYYGVIDVVI